MRTADGMAHPASRVADRGEARRTGRNCSRRRSRAASRTRSTLVMNSAAMSLHPRGLVEQHLFDASSRSRKILRSGPTSASTTWASSPRSSTCPDSTPAGRPSSAWGCASRACRAIGTGSWTRSEFTAAVGYDRAVRPARIARARSRGSKRPSRSARRSLHSSRAAGSSA